MLSVAMATRDKHGHKDAELHRGTTRDWSTQDSANDRPRTSRSEFFLTILHHPDGRRVGGRISVGVLAEGVPFEVSRLTPGFLARGAKRAQPLGHPRLSRAPVWLRAASEVVSITPSRKDLRVEVDGRAIKSRRDVELAAVRERGVSLALGGCVLLYLHEFPASGAARTESLRTADELFGERIELGVSPATSALECAIARVAPLPGPVFLRSEAGVDTESVARAIHRLSSRPEAPWVSVDLATVPTPLVAMELFGGGSADRPENAATRAKTGCFAHAHGGALFVKNVDRLPMELQTRFLWHLDRSHVREAGHSHRPDVRTMTATNIDLQELVAAGRMLPELAYRLQGLILDVPPLRVRKADIPLLLHGFLRTALAEFDAVPVLDRSTGDAPPGEWLRLRLIKQLMRYSFPDNDAELRNIAVQMATFDHDRPYATLPAFVKERLKDAALSAPVDESSAHAGQILSSPRGGRKTSRKTDRQTSRSGRSTLSDEVVRATLRQNEWNITRTARALGIAKNTLKARIRTLPDIRLASDLECEEILRAQRTHGTDLETLARALEVSSHGLRLRRRELGID